MNEIPQIKPESGLDATSQSDQGGEERKAQVKLPNIKLRISKPVAGALVAIGVLVIVFLIIPAVSLFLKSRVLTQSGRELEEAFRQRDLGLVRSELTELKSDFGSFQSSYTQLGWTKVIPFVGGYWKDGGAAINAGIHGIEAAEVAVATVEPYADLVGFSQEDGSGGKTANDRVEFLARTIEQVLPNIDPIAEKIALADAEIQKIDPDRYPQQVAGRQIRGRILQAQELSRSGVDLFTNGKSFLEAVPYLIGIDEPRRYLVIFQNDKELRPTGGFLTAYSVAEVNAGKFAPTTTDDIYNLDERYRATIAAPEPFLKFIREPYSRFPEMRLRDMNWSPDFAESMELFFEEAKTVGIDNIDGIIAVDTHVAVNLLEVLGQIGVSGYGNFSAESDSRCDCPQVVYELESFADVEGAIVWSENEPGKIVFAPPNYENRKKIVGPLMNSMLANALGQPREKLPDLFQAAWKSLTEKHVLVYVFDDKIQRGIEAFGIGGNIKDFDGDYLHVNDANLGGRKSNLYVTHEVQQQVEADDAGNIIKTLTLTYNNPQDQDGWLNSVLPNWTRVYVPKGSELISSEGFDEAVTVQEELGKTVFAGSFELRPKGVKKIIISYKLPFTVDKEYRLLIQKQPGKDAPLYSINFNGRNEEFFLRADRELRFSI